MMCNKILVLSFSLICLACCGGRSSDFITAAGVVDGEVITVKAEVSGEIETLNIAEGSAVAEDDILVIIEAKKIENQLQGLNIQEREVGVNRKKLERKIKLLRNTLDYWEEQVSRFERLEKKESISGDQLEQARLKREEVEASLFDAQQSLSALSIQSASIQNQKERLNLLLEDHVVASPVTGVVIEKFVSQGETVFPGTPVADILDRSSLFVETFFEEQEISRLKLGQKVEVLVDGLEGRVFEGTIVYFGQKAEFSPKYIISEKERRSLLYRVKVRLEGDLEVFKLGMPVTVRVAKN